MKKLLSAVVAMSVVFGAVGSAFAAPGQQDYQKAFDFMHNLGCVSGFPDGTAHLSDNLTRAEAANLLVKCMGQDANAKILNGAAAFPDTATGWYSGAVAVAKNMGWVNGMPDGLFHPNDKVTVAQLLSMLDNVLGLQVNKSLGWPNSVIAAAEDAGFVKKSDGVESFADVFAPRGAAFYFANNAFLNVQLASGKTVYQTYVKTTAPTVTAAADKTTTTATTATITGTAKGATAVTVNGDAVTLNADGSFTYTAKLDVKANTFTVVASDVVGNQGTATVTVTRSNTAAASITVDQTSLTVTEGAAQPVKVTVLDTNGAAIANATVAATLSSADLGKFDATTNTFTAGTKAGSGTLTLTSGSATVAIPVTVNAGQLASIQISPANVSVQSGNAQQFTAKGLDKDGNTVALSNVTWSVPTGQVIDTAKGVFAATTSGNVTITATSGTVSGSTTATVFGAESALKIGVPTDLIGNAKHVSTVTVKVVDAAGSVVGNSSDVVNVSAGAGSAIVFQNADGTTSATASAKAVNGQATFKVITNAIGATSTSISATSGSLTGDLQTVSATAPVAASINLATNVSANTVEASGTLQLTATLVDTEGVAIPAPTGGIVVTVANGNTTAAALATTTLTINGGSPTSANDALTLLGQQGTIAITGTASGYTVNPVTINTKLAGSPTQLVMTKAPVDTSVDSLAATQTGFTVAYVLEDANGTVKSNITGTGTDNLTLTVKNADGSVWATNASPTIANGVATFNVFGTAPIKSGTLSFSVAGTDTSVAGQTLTLAAPAAVTAKALPGAATGISAVTVNSQSVTAGTAYTLVANGSQTASLSVSIVDQYGNVVPNATNAVTFAQTKGTGSTVLYTTAPSTLTVTPVNGVASIVATSGITDAGGKFDVYTATAAGSTANTQLGAAQSVELTTQVVGKAATIATQTAPAAQTAGTSFNVTFQVNDANGRFVSTDNGTPVSLEIDNGSTVVTTLNANTVNGVATFPVTLTTASTNYTFKATATINGTAQNASYTGQAVNAAAAAKVVVAPVMTSIEGGTTEQVSLNVVDAYGNTATGTLPAVVYTINGVAESAQSTGLGFTYLSAGTGTNNTANGRTLQVRNTGETLTIGVQGGSVTPTGSTTAIPVTSASVTSYLASGAYKLGVTTAPATASAGSDVTLVIGEYDANGNLKNLPNSTLPGTITITPATGNNNPAVLTPAVTVKNGTFSVDLGNVAKAGTYSYTVTASGLQSTNFTAVVTPGSAAAVASAGNVNLTADGSSVQILTFNVTDGANGNTVSTYNGTMNFTVTGSGATLLATSAPIVNGVAKVQVKASTQTGTLVVTPSIVGNPSGIVYTSAAASVIVGAGAPVAANSSVSTQVSGATTTVYVMLRDANLNNVTGLAAANFVQVSDANGTVIAGAPTFAPVGNGVYTATAGTGYYGVKVTVGSTSFILH